MTAGNNGAGAPENDDPFAYLYRSEGGDEDAGANAAPHTGGYGYPGPGQPGVPRTSYNKVTRVGERQYGQQTQQTTQQPYASQGSSHYAAPETLPGGAARQSPPSHGGGGHGGGRGPNSKGLLIGAIAVVAVVITGIGVAMVTNNNEDGGEKTPARASAPSTSAKSDKPSEEPTQKAKAELPKEDAASLRLDHGATTASVIKGAKSSSGAYVGMNAPGAAATWSVNVEKAGRYQLYVGYGVPGKDGNLTLTVNGKPDTRPLNMTNFAKAKPGDWEKGWTYTYAFVNLKEGGNTIRVSCETGNQCDVVLDQVWLTQGKSA
jgi:hypothetical protein